MGSGADRQLRVFRETGSIVEVAKYIHRETNTGLFEDVTPFLNSVHPPSPDALAEKQLSIKSENDPS
jgi:hypothetical protein